MSLFTLSLALDVSSLLGFAGVAAVIFGFLILLILKGKSESHFANYCKKVSAYLAESGKVTKENQSNLTEACFDNGAPEAIKQAWQAYCAKPFGYPSSYFDAALCVPPAKKDKFRRVYLPIYVVFIALAFAASFVLDTSQNKLYSMVCIPVGALLWFALYLIKNKQESKLGVKDSEAFSALMDDLDVNVFTQNLFEYTRDVSDLQFVSKAIDEIAEYESGKPLPEREKVFITPSGEESSVPTTKKSMKLDEVIKAALEEKSSAVKPVAVPAKPSADSEVKSYQTYEQLAQARPQVLEQNAQYAQKQYTQSYKPLPVEDFSVDPVVYPPIKFDVPQDQLASLTLNNDNIFADNSYEAFEQETAVSSIMPAEPVESFENSYLGYGAQQQFYSDEPHSTSAFPTAEPVDEAKDNPFNIDSWDELEIERNSDSKGSFWKTGRKKR